MRILSAYTGKAEFSRKHFFGKAPAVFPYVFIGKEIGKSVFDLQILGIVLRKLGELVPFPYHSAQYCVDKARQLFFPYILCQLHAFIAYGITGGIHKQNLCNTHPENKPYASVQPALGVM